MHGTDGPACPEPLRARPEPTSRSARLFLLIKETDLGPAAPAAGGCLPACTAALSSPASFLSSSSLLPAPWSLRRGREAGNPKALN